MNNRLHGPAPSREQAQLIDNLGGPSAVAGLVTERYGLQTPLRSQTVSMWKRRGIPYRHRPLLAAEAKAIGVPLPDGFISIDPDPRPETIEAVPLPTENNEVPFL